MTSKKPHNPSDQLVLPEFGAYISVSERYERVVKLGKIDKPHHWRRRAKTWERRPFSAQCLFLGTRTLRNGSTHFDSELGWVFTPSKSLQAALVCPNKRTNPIYVPIDTIKSTNKKVRSVK